MHDHQSDWKSIYSDLDDMNNVDNLDNPLMGGDSTRSFISSQQLSHAKSVFRQMKQKTFQALNKLTGLKSKDKRIVQIKVNDLFTHAEINLQNVDYDTQVSNLIHRTKIQLHRIIIINKFAGQINLIVKRFKGDVLTKSQQNAAITEMKAIKAYTRQDLVKSQTIASQDGSYISGKNSVNGALVKYIADGQINIGNQLKQVSNKVRQNIEVQPNLNIAAKYLAYQRIDTVKTNLMADLMSAGDFTALSKVKKHGMQQLKSILSDKDKILENLTIFNQFVSKVRSMIAEFSQLSTSAKLQLQQRIDNYQKTVETKVQQLHHNAPESEFTYREHYLSTMVVDTIASACRRRLTSQKMKLTSSQQQSLNEDLDLVIEDIHNDFDQSHLKDSIEDSLTRGIKRLRNVVSKIDVVIYRNHIHQFVSDINSRINQLYELSNKNQARLQSRIQIIGKHLLDNPDDVTVASAKNRLYSLFEKQSHYMIQASIHKIFNNLYQQIKSSHLSVDQTHQFLQQLINIRRKSDVDYESKQLLIRNVLSHSLTVDKNENLRRMTKLNEDLHHQIQSFDIASQLDSALRHDLINFSQRINDADKLSVADHEEQQFESLAYRKLYHLYAGTDSPQAEALQVVIMKSEQVHQLINAAILDPQINWQANEKVSKYTNAHLYELLKIREASELKQYVRKLVKNIQDEVVRVRKYLKKVYIDQVNQLFKKVDYQLKAYSVNWGVLHKADVIQERTIRTIKAANDLLKTEYAKQCGYQQINGLVNKVIGVHDSHRRHANQRINKLIQLINERLHQIRRSLNGVNYAFLNRTLRFENLARYHINQCVDSDLEETSSRYVKSLSRILRQSYLREWLIFVKRAHTMIKDLSNVPTGAKLRSLRSIQSLKLEVTLKLRKCDQTDLSKVLNNNNNKVQSLITHSIYLDPVKKSAYRNLTNLVKQIRSQIQHSFDKKSSKRMLAKLDDMSQNVDDQLRLNDDHKVETVYNSKFKELKTFELKLTRKIQLNHFTEFTHKFNKRLDGMKMLADREIQQSNESFNRYYHKAVYKISHAANLAECQRNERLSRKAIDKILAKDQTINDSKQKFYTSVEKKIMQAKQQIVSLKSLQTKDKRDSNKLLDQIKQQTYQNVKQSMSRNQMLDAETKSHKMIKQVIDKVSSASVLVAAIKSANNQISQSTLDKQQKSATLKQINQIIDQGIKSQFDQGKQSSRSKTSRHFERHHRNKNNGLEDFGIDMNKPNLSGKSQGHGSIMSSIINAVKNFFRWIGGVLAKAF